MTRIGPILNILSLLYAVHCHDFSLSDFHISEGIMKAGEYTRIEIKRPQPLRIVVQSISGDADLYVGYHRNVSYMLHEHNGSSTSCGLDYIDLSASPRPVYLAIYGHPSYNASAWRLLINFGKNSTYTIGEFNVVADHIYNWESFNVLDTEEEDIEALLPHYLMDLIFRVMEVLLAIL